MKRISFLFAVLIVLPLFVCAQDAATEERLNKLQNQVETLQANNVDLQKRLSEITKELAEVREQAARPPGNFASADDVKQLAEKMRELDRKRADDRELILKEIDKLGKAAAAGISSARHPVRVPDGPTGDKPTGPEKGYEYVIQSGDTLSTVVAEYRKQGVKVTLDQVLKANPGLKATSLKVGQKIFIPSSAP